MSKDIKTSIPFMKMHGLGNDFVIIDRRSHDVCVDSELARAMGDRHRGIGFDQLAVLEASAEADIRLTFYNADGTTAGACGNATRCIARHELDRAGNTSMTLLTERGLLQATDEGDSITAVNMGHPLLDWGDVPLARQMDTLCLPIEGEPTATGMGNPHCTFFVPDADDILLEDYAHFEHHPLFPERTNVQVASVVGENHLRMRVWERGVGATLASGSSSCATTAAAVRRGLTGKTVRVDLDGGTLWVDWREDGLWMSGRTAHVFDGVWYP
ncbi:MAG: diaminopimelate epimerase [Litoreibacter sp.]